MKSNTLSTLATSQAAANRATKSLTADDLQRIIDSLQRCLVTKRKREENIAKEKREAALKELETMLSTICLSDKEIRKLLSKGSSQRVASKGSASKAKSKKRKKVAPKYSIKSGREVHKWTGRGRMPLVFKEFVEKGGSLDQCLIK